MVYFHVTLFITNIIIISFCLFILSDSHNIENFPQKNNVSIINISEEMKDPEFHKKNNNISLWRLIYNMSFDLIKFYFLSELMFYVFHFIHAMLVFILGDVLTGPYERYMQDYYDNLQILAPDRPTKSALMIELPPADLYLNTILYPSFIGPELYTQDEIWYLTMKFEQDFYIYSEQLFIQNDQTLIFRNQHVILDYLHNHPQRDTLFSCNYNDLQNNNYIINQLIQNCIIQYGLTNNRIYYDMGLSLFIEQIALLNDVNPLNYCDDPIVINKLQEEFWQYFRI